MCWGSLHAIQLRQPEIHQVCTSDFLLSSKEIGNKKGGEKRIGNGKGIEMRNENEIEAETGKSKEERGSGEEVRWKRKG